MLTTIDAPALEQPPADLPELRDPGVEHVAIERRVFGKADLDPYRDPTNRKMRPATEADGERIIDRSTVVHNPVTGAPEIVYLRLAHDFEPLRARLDAHRGFRPQMRTNGIAQVAEKFGVRPRTSFRSPNCEQFALARNNPALNAELLGAADLILPWYRHYNRELFDLHTAAVADVHPEWQWNPVFTSGNVNRDSQLPYHYDAGNFRSVWSGMFGLKAGIERGYLAVPEYGLLLEIADGSLTMFDGQGALHGVTPIRRIARGGHRYTIVYYGLKGVWQCLEPAAEAQRANVLRTAREARRAKGIIDPTVTKQRERFAAKAAEQAEWERNR